MADETPESQSSAALATTEPTAHAAKPAGERLVMLTGATAGIGRAAAEQLANKGASIIFVARDADRGEQTLESIKATTGHDAIELMVADLSLMSDVRRVAADFIKSGRKLDGLINNAGVKLATRSVTSEGFETTLAVNHLAPYLLSKLLKENLASDGGGRVVNVSSFMHKRGSANLDDLQRANGYDERAVYSSSKLLNLLTTYAQAREWEPDGVFVNAYNPGFVRTNMTRGGFVGVVSPLFAKSPRLAGDGLVFVAVSPRVEGIGGAFYQATGAMKNSSPESYDKDLQARVVEATEKLLAGS